MTEENGKMTQGKKRSWGFLLYLPAVAKGLFNTLLHILKLKGHKTFTVQYPETVSYTHLTLPTILLV